jgi:hypothetical protein
MEKYKAKPEPHSDLPDFMLLFNQIAHYLADPKSASAEDLKVAQEAFDKIAKVLYCEKCIRLCSVEHPSVGHWR